MKKFLLILLALAMCTGLCACSTYSASPGKVTNNDGETEEMTPRDLCEINDDDEDECDCCCDDDDCDCDCDCCCDDDDDCDCCCGDDDDDCCFYEVKCPQCGDELALDEEVLELGAIDCPNCGATLEFEFDEDDEVILYSKYNHG